MNQKALTAGFIKAPHENESGVCPSLAGKETEFLQCVHALKDVQVHMCRRPKMLGRLSSENVCDTADLRDQRQGTFHWVIPESVLSQTTVYLSVPASQKIKSRQDKGQAPSDHMALGILGPELS